MLIKSITVTNFLPFQNEQRIEFSTDPDRNVTLIMGNNGAGKTSLAQAFEWCLYGHSPKDSSSVINAFVRDHITPGNYRYASVAIEIEKDGRTFTVSRSQKYARRASGNMDKPGQHEFGITYKENGETRQVASADQQSTINQLLSSELSHYFFFDGEHVKSMRKEIESGKSSDFAEAVKSILGLQPIASALAHLKAPGAKLSVEKWFNRQFDFAGDKSLQESQNRINTLEKTIERVTGEKEIAEGDAQSAIEYEEKCRNLLLENQASEDAQRAVDKARHQQNQAKVALSSRRDALFKVFRNGYYRLMIERVVQDAQKELADEDKISKGIPSVDNKTIEFLLERHECICGQKFKTGDDIFQHLTELLAYVPPKDLGTYISEFDKDCRIRLEQRSTLIDDLDEAFRLFSNAENGIKNADNAYEAAKQYLDGLNNVDVGILRANLKKAQADRNRTAVAVDNARRQISRAHKEIEELNSEIKQFSVKNEKNLEVKRCLQYVEYLYNYLDTYYSQHEAKTRIQLGETVNKFFSAMYDGEMHLELDDNYGVTVTVDDVETSGEAWKTSSGQTLAIILAFILGILDISKSMSGKDDSLLKGDTYPLVMDAPLSDFDKTRIGTICKLLPEVAEQVIIIIKDTDGELAEDHMRDRIGRRYNIERVRDYQSEIKE